MQNEILLSERQVSSMQEFVLSTYKLLFASLFAGTVGAYLGTLYNHVLGPYYIGLIIIEFIFLFGVIFSKNKPGLNLFMLFAFTMVSGLTLGPILSSTLSLANGGQLVTNAFLLTTVAFGGLSLYGMTTKRSFLGLGKYLFIGLIILIVASLINLFIGSTLLLTITSSVAAFLFSVMIVYDTQRIYAGEFETPVQAALSMYLNILNLFISLLNLLRIFGGEE